MMSSLLFTLGALSLASAAENQIVIKPKQAQEEHQAFGPLVLNPCGGVIEAWVFGYGKNYRVFLKLQNPVGRNWVLKGDEIRLSALKKGNPAPIELKFLGAAHLKVKENEGIAEADTWSIATPDGPYESFQLSFPAWPKCPGSKPESHTLALDTGGAELPVSEGDRAVDEAAWKTEVIELPMNRRFFVEAGGIHYLSHPQLQSLFGASIGYGMFFSHDIFGAVRGKLAVSGRTILLGGGVSAAYPISIDEAWGAGVEGLAYWDLLYADGARSNVNGLTVGARGLLQRTYEKNSWITGYLGAGYTAISGGGRGPYIEAGIGYRANTY